MLTLAFDHRDTGDNDSQLLLWDGVAQPAFAAALREESAPAAHTTPLDPASFTPPLRRLRVAETPESLRQLPAIRRPADNPLTLDEDDSPLSLEASVGTLVHRILELIAKNGLENWSTAKVQSLQPTWQNWLQQRGHTPKDARNGSQEAVQALSTTLESETGRWLLSPHDQSAAEQAWTSRDGESALNHIIDRSFITNGVRWVVDYKTVRASEDELPPPAQKASARNWNATPGYLLARGCR